VYLPTIYHTDWYTFMGTNFSQELPASIFSLLERGQQAKSITWYIEWRKWTGWASKIRGSAGTPKYWYQPTKLHSIIFQITVLFTKLQSITHQTVVSIYQTTHHIPNTGTDVLIYTASHPKYWYCIPNYTTLHPK